MNCREDYLIACSWTILILWRIASIVVRLSFAAKQHQAVFAFVGVHERLWLITDEGVVQQTTGRVKATRSTALALMRSQARWHR